MNSIASSNWTFVALILLIAGLFYLPPIRNHSEAEDAYWYARNVEIYSYPEVVRPNHRLYHPLAKAVFELSGQERSFPVLVALSAFFSGGALALFYLLVRRFAGCSPLASLGWVACLAFSYGFWRYGREVEVYALGWLVSLSTIACFFGLKNKWYQGILFALLVVLALNFHRALGPPLAMTALGYLLFKKQWISSLSALVVGVGLYFLVEGISQNLPRAPVEQRDVVSTITENTAFEEQKAEKNFSLLSFPKAAIGLGACLLGGNVVMSSDSVFDLLQTRVFRYRFLQEERFMAKSASPSQIWFWGISLLGLLGMFAVALGMIFRQCDALISSIGPESGAVLLGSFAYAGMILIFEPGNPEMWLLGLPIFWLSIVLLLGDLFKEKVLLFALLFAVTNYLGGLSLLGSEKNDYHFVTSQLVRSEASDGDVYLLGSRNMVHIRFAKYRKNLRVISVLGGAASDSSYLEEVKDQLRSGRRVFAHRTYCDSFENLQDFLLREGLELSLGDNVGGYEINLRSEN